MAGDLARAGAVCLAFAEALGPSISPPMAEIVSAVTERLSRRPAPDGERHPDSVSLTNRRACCGALVDLASNLLTEPLPTPQADRLGELITSGRLASSLNQAHVRAGARSGEGIVEVADRLRRAGVDAERLLDSVILHETGRHHGLVWHQVNRVVNSYPGYTPDELFGFGWRGLRVALYHYDPTRVSFSTYACTRICGHIADGVRSESPIPKRLNTWYRKVSATTDDLTAQLGRPPTETEVASAVTADRLARDLGRQATLAEIAECLEAERRQLAMLPRLGVPEQINEQHAPSILDDPADAVILVQLRDEVRAAVGSLPPDERAVIESLELGGKSIEETARHLGTSARQVRALRQRGRALLAERLSGWKPSMASS